MEAEITKEVFPDSPYKIDSEPELRIARGLALWGRVYVRTASFREEKTMRQNNEIETIIGFDLGHGETALTWVRADNNEEPQSLLIHQKKSQITAIAHDPQKGTIIGERAYLLPGATDFQIAFKKRPSDDPSYQNTIREFVKAIYQHLIDTRQIEEGVGTRFFIGCPSGWNDEEIRAYEQLLSAYTLPNVTVVKESRAALMHAKESKLFVINQLNKSVLVIDIGSSTTDFTLVKGMEEHPKDFGYDLGASLIDKAILAWTLTNHEDRQQLEELFEQQPAYRYRCELRCRKAKEEYFSYPDLYEEQDVNAGVEKIQRKYSFEPFVNGEIIREILKQPLPELGDKSWPDAFRDQLKQVKQNLEKEGIKPSAILLTGGASKMRFIPQVCKAVFPDSPYKPDGEPELCIARGLARWGRVDVHTARFMEEVNQFLDKEVEGIVGNQIPALRDLLADVLVDGLLDEVLKPCLRSWRNGYITTLNELESRIMSKAKDWLQGNEAKKRITNKVSEWLNKIGKELGEKTNPICRKYGLDPGQLAPQPVDLNPDTGNFSGSMTIGDPTVITGITVFVVDVVVGFVSLVIIGFLADILIILGPIGAIIGLLSLFIAVGVGHDAAEEWIKDRNIPKSVRGWVSDEKISNIGQEKKPELRAKIQEMLTQDQTWSHKIIQGTTQGLRVVVKEQADGARLLLL